MIELSPKIKLLIIMAAVFLAAVVAAVVVLLVKQKNNVAKIDSISFEVANEQMMVGEQKELFVTIYPNNAKNKNLVFLSSNENVLRVIASGNNTVTIEAIAAGQAKIIARAKSNKNIEDSCNIQISDTIAEAMSLEMKYVEGYVNEDMSVGVELNPINANYHKISIISYTNSIIKSPKIVIDEENNIATVDFKIKEEGNGQIMIGFMADQNGKETVILTDQLNVHGKPVEVGDLTFAVKSNSHSNYISSEELAATTGANFLIGSRTESYMFKILENERVIEANNIVYDANIFDVEKSDSNIYTFRLSVDDDDNIITTGWNVANVVFEYGDKNLVLTFVEGALPISFSEGDITIFNATKTDGKYQLKKDKSYLLNLSDDLQKLIYYGFARMQLATSSSEAVSLDGLLFKCNSIVSQIGFVLNYNEYWNNYYQSNTVQKEIGVLISNENFEEC